MSNTTERGCRLRGGSTSSNSSGGHLGSHTSPAHHNNKAATTGPEAPAAPPPRSTKPSCCLCWCCCCSCSCVAAKRADNGTSIKDGNTGTNCDGEPPPTLEEIRSWGQSFDSLMKNPAGRKVFRDFLKCEYSEENILFWQACEELKKEQNPDVVEEKARLIYEDYISILSPKEVSLDSRVREVINRNMVDPTPHTFDEAQLQIYTLMHRDSYPRFINSAQYKALAQLTNNGNTGSGSGTPGGSGRKESNA